MLPAHHGVAKWRAEPPPEDILLLVSCMHAGSRVVRLSKSATKEWGFEVLAKFEEHKSMNYGSDCQPDLNDEGQRTFITTSFYDRMLCLWRY
jgi:diphthamide biosynthesis protein 7